MGHECLLAKKKVVAPLYCLVLSASTKAAGPLVQRIINLLHLFGSVGGSEEIWAGYCARSGTREDALRHEVGKKQLYAAYNRGVWTGVFN